MTPPCISSIKGDLAVSVQGMDVPHVKEDKKAKKMDEKSTEKIRKVEERRIQRLAEKTRKEEERRAKPDQYTEDVLRGEFQTYKEYVLKRKRSKEVLGLAIRMPNMSEDISENIVKFIIHYHVGDTTSKWTKGIVGNGPKITGDLFSETEGTQEVKCFTSDGPPTFGPKEKWDVIYFLDAREWLQDRFALWRVALKNNSPEWKGIKVNEDETFEEQSNAGRRPRITWGGLHAQLGEHAVKVFDGSFDDIFKEREVEPDGPQ